MKRAHASRGANRKCFMIRTSLRISLRTRNRTFVNVIAARRASAKRETNDRSTVIRRSLKVVPHGPELVEVQGVCGGCAMALQTGCNASEEIVSQLARSLCRPSNTTGADGHNWFNALLKT